jgi:hypothetical protein
VRIRSIVARASRVLVAIPSGTPRASVVSLKAASPASNTRGVPSTTTEMCPGVCPGVPTSVTPRASS